MPAGHAPETLSRFLKGCLPEMLRTLRRLVEAESPSIEKRPSDRCCRLLAKEWRRRGASVEILPQRDRGGHVRVHWTPAEARRSRRQLLVLGHYDTVYAGGTLRKMPWRLHGAKASGPGVFDMKAGIVQALFALHALRKLRLPVRKRLVFLWTSDEEIGSGTSRKHIEKEARRSDAVFVLEPALGPRGHLKTSRKGVGEAEIMVRGRAAHAGLAPQNGINAAHELARQITRLEGWNDRRRGVTVNVGIIEGGTRVNVIPERARGVVDLRASTLRDMRRIEQRLRALRPILPGARLEVHGGFSRAPLERQMSEALYVRARSLAAKLGFALGESSAGGGSDGNFTAALGIPTLDGLGAVGDGAHSPGEYILIHRMPERAALLALLLACS